MIHPDAALKSFNNESEPVIHEEEQCPPNSILNVPKVSVTYSLTEILGTHAFLGYPASLKILFQDG